LFINDLRPYLADRFSNSDRLILIEFTIEFMVR
jgi:hypothetical protein